MTASAAGAGWLVVWSDLRSGQELDIYGARVSSAGVVQDRSGVPLYISSRTPDYPAIAFDGTQALVVWEDRVGSTGPADVLGVRWKPASGPLDTTAIPISTATSDQTVPAVAVNGGFLVLWQDHRRGQNDVYGARVAGNGSVTDPNGFLVTGGGGNRPAVTKGSGSTWAVTYDRSDAILYATISPK